MAYLVQKKKRVKGRNGETREVPGNYYICWRSAARRRTRSSRTQAEENT